MRTIWTLPSNSHKRQTRHSETPLMALVQRLVLAVPSHSYILSCSTSWVPTTNSFCVQLALRGEEAGWADAVDCALLTGWLLGLGEAMSHPPQTENAEVTVTSPLPQNKMPSTNQIRKKGKKNLQKKKLWMNSVAHELIWNSHIFRKTVSEKSVFQTALHFQIKLIK